MAMRMCDATRATACATRAGAMRRATRRVRARATRRANDDDDDGTCRITAREDGAVLFEFGVARTEEEAMRDVVVERDDDVDAAAARDMRVVDEFVPATNAPARTPTRANATPLSKMKKAELVDECVRCGLDTTGTVAVLRARVSEHRGASSAVPSPSA